MLQEAKTVPEKDLRMQRFFGKRRSRRAGRAFCPAKRRHAKACSQQGSQKVSQNFLGKGATGIRAKSLQQCKLLRILPPPSGFPKKICERKDFLGKGGAAAQAVRFAPQNAGTQRRALNRAPKKYRRTFWEKEQPAFEQRVCSNANSCGFCRPLQGSRKRFANAKIFWEKEEPPRKPCVLPCKTLARKGVLRRGCGGRIRTCDLRVMSPTSYRTAPLRDIGTPSAEMLYNFIALPSVCQLFFTRQSKIFADAPRRAPFLSCKNKIT